MPNTPDPWYWRTGSEEIDPLQMQSAQLNAAKQRLDAVDQYSQQGTLSTGEVTMPTVVAQGRTFDSSKTQEVDPARVAAMQKKSVQDMKRKQKIMKNGGWDVLKKQQEDADKRVAAIDAARNPGMQKQEPTQEPKNNLERMTLDSIKRGWGGVIPQRPRTQQPPTNA